MVERITGVAVIVMVISEIMGGVIGLRFMLEKEECLSHKVEHGATVRASFVVVKVHGWRQSMNSGADLVVSQILRSLYLHTTSMHNPFVI